MTLLTEILYQIFSYIGEYNSLHFGLSRVCKQWRHILRDDQYFWEYHTQQQSDTRFFYDIFSQLNIHDNTFFDSLFSFKNKRVKEALLLMKQKSKAQRVVNPLLIDYLRTVDTYAQESTTFAQIALPFTPQNGTTVQYMFIYVPDSEPQLRLYPLLHNSSIYAQSSPDFVQLTNQHSLGFIYISRNYNDRIEVSDRLLFNELLKITMDSPSTTDYQRNNNYRPYITGQTLVMIVESLYKSVQRKRPTIDATYSKYFDSEPWFNDVFAVGSRKGTSRKNRREQLFKYVLSLDEPMLAFAHILLPKGGFDRLQSDSSFVYKVLKKCVENNAVNCLKSFQDQCNPQYVDICMLLKTSLLYGSVACLEFLLPNTSPEQRDRQVQEYFLRILNTMPFIYNLKRVETTKTILSKAIELNISLPTQLLAIGNPAIFEECCKFVALAAQDIKYANKINLYSMLTHDFRNVAPLDYAATLTEDSQAKQNIEFALSRLSTKFDWSEHSLSSQNM